ncbi:hypothetical protein HPB49_023992 [Dermacentor silvarum]|uniref:Uncharacterized protein n=1 Tax=Dermacentor silvarum TaxID=543639 RepID=A0ACB8E4Z7_DERSI|nr:hypothetical protein HPB49_023992 [Dermacentor silvarum]
MLTRHCRATPCLPSPLSARIMLVRDHSQLQYGFLLSRWLLQPIVVDGCERSKTLSTNRRTLWLARINRAYLDPQNLNLRVCGAHFVTDWAPSLHLGYSIGQADAHRYERSELRRQRKRRQRKTGVCTPDNLAANRAV